MTARSCAAYVARRAATTSGASARTGGQHGPDLEDERLTADGLGQGGQRPRPNPGAFDERADHGLSRQRSGPEHAGVQHRRVHRVRADEREAFLLGQAGGGGEMLDRACDPLSVDRQRGAQLFRKLGDELGVVGGRVGQELLDVVTMRAGHLPQRRPGARESRGE
jgi:hypothetical protein